MERLPQLFMRHEDLSKLPPFFLPGGYSLHSYSENDEEVWEEIMEKAFGIHFTFEANMKNWKGYNPEKLMFLEKDGRDIASAAGFEKEEFPGEGWLHMVGTVPEACGKGAGRAVVLAALHAMAADGFRSAVLSTDDERIPAISRIPLCHREKYPANARHILHLCEVP